MVLACDTSPNVTPATETLPKVAVEKPTVKVSPDVVPKVTETAPLVEILPQKSSKFHPSFRKGIALGLFVSKKEDPKYELSIYKKMLKEIAATGATDLSLPVRWVQQDVSKSEIFPAPETTVSDAILVAVITEAKSLGLRVFLMPFIHLKERGKGQWRGTIKPKDREMWWVQYGKFIYHYADIAAAQNIETFSVGSELSSMRDPKAWSKIILGVRKRLPKTQLTYSANWDRFEAYGNWRELDVIGVSTYPPLTKLNKPTLKQLKTGWGGFKRRLRDVRRRFPKKKILFTEVGYSASKYAAKTPWVHAGPKDKVNQELQALLYQSLLETWSKPKYLEGMFIWNWFGRGGPEDSGFSPKGKKAELLLKEWY